MKRPLHILRATIPVLLVSLWSTKSTAADKTWDGGGTPLNWTVGENWDLDLAPVANDALFFDGTTGLAAVNNFAAGTAFNGLAFNAGAGSFNLSGTQLTLNGNIVDNATTLQTISLPMRLNAQRSIEVVTGGSLAVTGGISGTAGLGLTKLGEGTLTFSSGNGFAGPLQIDAGAVVFNGGGSLQSSVLTVISVNSGGRLRFDRNDSFGNDSTLTGVSVVINPGGVVENGNVYTTFPILTLNGGELRANVGNGGAGYEAYQLRVVNVGGTTASTITTTGALNSFSRISLGYGGNTNVQFNVADVTGNSDADLTVSAVLRNAGNATSGFTKNGPGTMVLKGLNEYTGTTAVRGGTLTLDASTGQIAAGSLISLVGNGVFNFQSAATGSAKTINLAFTTGDGTVRSTYGASGNTALTLGTFTRAVGAVGNFEVSGGNAAGPAPTNLITFASAPAASVVLDQGLFVGSNYAAYDAAGFIRAYAYSTDANGLVTGGGATLGAVTASTNVNLTGSVTNQTTASVNTLKIDGNQNVAIAAGETLTVNGIFKTGNVAGGTTVGGGAGVQAEPNKDLVIRTEGINDAVTIDADILANGASALTKSGLGSLTLNGTNTYTGPTTVNGGAVTVNGTSTYAGSRTVNGATLTYSAPNTFSGSTTVNGGALNQTAGTYTGAGSVTVDQGGVVNLGGTNSYTGGTFVNSGTLTLPVDATSTGGGALYVGLKGQVQIDGTVTASNVDIDGTATVTGILNVASNTIFYVGSNPSTQGANGLLTLAAGAQINVTGTLNNDNMVFGRDGGIGTVTQNGGTFDFNPSTAKDLYLGAGGGAVGTYNLNAGMLDMHSRNIFLGHAAGTGIFNLNAGGTVKTGSISAGNAPVQAIVNLNGGTLQPSVAGANLLAAGPAVRVQAGGAVIDTAGLAVTVSAPLLHDPALEATADGGLRKKGDGVLTLTGGSTFTGGTVVEAGTLAFAGGGTVLNSATSPISVETGATLLFNRNDVFGRHVDVPLTPITLKEGSVMTNGGAFVNVVGPLTLSGGTLTSTAGLSALLPAWGLKANVLVNGATTSTISSGGLNGGIALGEAEVTSTTFTVLDGAAASDLTITAPIQDAAHPVDNATIPSTLIKMGDGTMTLAGVNPYTGPTMLNEGRTILAAPGSLAASSLTTVASGAELTGDGTTGALSISGSLSPGLALGTLKSGAASFLDQSRFVLEIGSTTADQLDASGTVTLNGVIALDISLLADPTEQTAFTIINSTGLLGADALGGARFMYGSNVLEEGEIFHVTSGAFSQDFSITYVADAGQDVVLNAVPEPGSVGLLLGGLGLLAARRRQRSGRS